VWQDGVGGLQTYCRTCNVWVDIPPSPTVRGTNLSVKEPSESETGFVIHVGDMTSLAIRQAQRELLLRKDDASISSALINTSYPSTRVTAYDQASCGAIFPSPLHRVLSPTSVKRFSLVYFAYPAPFATLNDLIHELKGWRLLPPAKGTKVVGTEENTAMVRNHQNPDDEILFEDYYLLMDQDQIKGAEHKSAFNRFQEVLNVPIRRVLDEKWRQVQRPSADNIFLPSMVA
jgi:hypothetical protein